MNEKTNPKPVKLKSARVLFLVEFPIFYLECISERHIIVAGGGGSSNTGVVNQINMFELIPSEDSCSAKLILQYFTPEDVPDAIMNASLMRNQPTVSPKLVSSGDQIVVYKLCYNPEKKNFNISGYDKFKNFKRDTTSKGLKCIPERILCGSSDGNVGILDATNPGKVLKLFKAHDAEIDEIDYDPYGDRVVTLSRDQGNCCVWSLSNSKPVMIITPDTVKSDMRYKLRSCRFACDITSNSDKKNQQPPLLITCNPRSRGPPCKICIWKTTDTTVTPASIAIQVDSIMSMNVSEDGKFVGIGSGSGSVLVFDIARRKQIYRIDGAHTHMVTNLQFLPTKPESLSLTNSKICALLSVSIDRRIVLHRPEKLNIYWILQVICMIALIYGILYYINRLTPS